MNTEGAQAPCYLCALYAVPAVVVFQPFMGPALRLPGICDLCKRVHLTPEPNK